MKQTYLVAKYQLFKQTTLITYFERYEIST